MSVDCGQFSGVNNCRFSNAAGSYYSLEDAYLEVDVPSEAMALRGTCEKGKNVSESNSITSFQNQAFGSFNSPPSAPVPKQK
jgi:hypothetical protein